MRAYDSSRSSAEGGSGGGVASSSRGRGAPSRSALKKHRTEPEDLELLDQDAAQFGRQALSVTNAPFVTYAPSVPTIAGDPTIVPTIAGSVDHPDWQEEEERRKQAAVDDALDAAMGAG